MSPIPCVYWLSRLLILSVLMVQQGCTTSSMKPWAPHVAEDVRAAIRTIGVAVAADLPLVAVELRVVEYPSETARYARRKASNWSENWLNGSILNEIGGGGFLGTTIVGAMLVVTPVVWGAGAVAGAIEAPPAKEKQVHGVLQYEDLIHRLQNHVLTHVTERTDMSVVPLPRTANDPLGDRETVSASGVSQPDAILRIHLKSIDLRGASDIDPFLALHLDVQATLVAPSAVTPLYTHSFHYVTGARRFTEWTAEGAQSFDAQVFHETLDLSLARLAELMVDDLFLTHPFIHEHRRARDGS